MRCQTLSCSFSTLQQTTSGIAPPCEVLVSDNQMSLFRVFFVLLPLSLSVESTSYVPSFRMVFFYLVITGWILDIGLDEKSF